MKTKFALSPLIVSSLILMQACAPTLPVTKSSKVEIPASFPGKSDKANSEQSAGEITFQEFFHDPKLTALIEEALKNNQELAILAQEINISNNEIMARRGEYLPKFSAKADGGVEKAERFSTEDANEPIRFGKVGIVTSWEVDIWKRMRNATKAAYFKYLSSIEGRRYVQTNLIAEVANTYFELMALDNQLQIVENYVKILTQIRQMVDLQQKAARVTSLAVKRFEAEVLKNQSRLYELNRDIQITQNKMNLLLGRYPQKIERDSKEFLKLLFTGVKTSVPTKLLENRPDVKEAMYDLQSSELSVKAAKARFYPALSIEGGIGYEQFNGEHFEGTPTSLFYGIAGNLTAPLLNRNAIKADYFSANNKQIQAVYNYELTLIQAYTEVANQLTRIKNLDTVYSLKEKQVKALNEAINISNTLFRAARVDYIEALFTQRDALETQIELVEIKKQQLGASVNLYKALGGGWKGIKEKNESYY